MKPNFLFFLLLAGILSLSDGQKSVRLAQKSIMAELFSEINYDKRVRPAGLNEGSSGSKPVQVKINLYVRSIESLDDRQNQWTVQITYRSSWRDDRLTFNGQNGRIRYLSMKDTSRLWTPNTFFSNEKSGRTHEMPSPNTLVRVRPTGEVLYTTRLTLTLQCRMQLADFPADRQTCHIQMGSYAHTLEDLEYRWIDDRPIQVDTASLNIPHFRLVSYQTESCNASITTTGSYSCLRASFAFRRQVQHYILSLYLPLALFVIVSWVSFWINPRTDGTSRTLVTLFSLLGASALIAYFSDQLPPVPYTRRLDVYTGAALTFIFAAILESAAVNYLLSGTVHDDEAKGRFFRAMKSVRVDRIARAAFPLAFLAFVIVYSCATFTLTLDGSDSSGSEDSLFIVRKSSGL